MTDYYVSLVADLIGCYLHFKADDKEAVALYLQKTYLRGTAWRLPWCSIYSADELKENNGLMGRAPILIEAHCGPLYLEDYADLRRKR